MAPTEFQSGPLRGTVRVPGDKSISHRALIVAAACRGRTQIEGLNPGRDVYATAQALRACGVAVEVHGTTAAVDGGPLRNPDAVIDAMNSGTTVRLMMGACAGAGITASFDGDESLRKRPMEPLAAQLRAFGAHVDTSDGLLPAVLRGTTAPQTRHFILVHPSAQIKSALLLCGVFGNTAVTIAGDRGSRDHTERLLRGCGATIEFDERRTAYTPGPLHAGTINVPADISAAAFFMVAATITPGSDIVLQDVGVNPGRTGIIDALLEMGANITLSNRRTWGGEPVADVTVRAAQLRGTSIGPDLALRAIDEILVLSAAAAIAKGPTKITGIKDLRTKESDRIAAIGRILAAVEVSAEALPNGLTIAGGSVGSGRGTIATHGDHRTAMAVAALAAAVGPLSIDDASGIGVSFPDFIETMAKAQA